MYVCVKIKGQLSGIGSPTVGSRDHANIARAFYPLNQLAHPVLTPYSISFFQKNLSPI